MAENDEKPPAAAGQTARRMTDDDWLAMNLPMRWSIYENEEGQDGCVLQLAAPVPDGSYVVVDGCSDHEPIPGLKVIDGKFDPESTAEACYRAVCLGRLGMSEHHLRERPFIDHRFIERLVWCPMRQVFELWTGS